jgi:hypothetical protein
LCVNVVGGCVQANDAVLIALDCTDGELAGFDCGVCTADMEAAAEIADDIGVDGDWHRADACELTADREI